MTYTTIYHQNSNRARKAGLLIGRDHLGNPVPRDHWSPQVLRDPEGADLPRDIPASVMRGFRSRYRRHTGAKQVAKQSP